MEHRCELGHRLLATRERVQRGSERRRLLFFGCIICGGDWLPLDDMEFYERKPLTKRGALAEARLILEVHNA